MDNEIVMNMPVIRSILDSAENRIEEMTGLKVMLRMERVPTPDNNIDLGTVLIQECAKIWSVEIEYIIQRTRKKEPVAMRKVLSMLLRKRTDLSLYKISQRLGFSDHADVLHAVKSGTDLLEVNDEVLIKFYEPVKHLFIEEVKQ